MASAFALGLLFFCFCTRCILQSSKMRSRMETNRVAYTSSPGWLQTQRPNEGGQRRANNLLTRPTRNQTPPAPSAPPAGISSLGNIYSIPDTSTDKPPDVSFNPPTYEEATTGNVNWNPDPSAPDKAADKKY